jgi:opacity protein-like surface antigen
VEIPFGLKLRTREFGYLRYFLEPQIALGIRTQARGNIKNATGVDPEEKFNISSAVNLFNLSWGLGAGIEYGVSDNTALVAGLAFQSGFADVSRNKNTQIIDSGRSREDDSKAKVTAFILRLGVMF